MLRCERKLTIWGRKRLLLAALSGHFPSPRIPSPPPAPPWPLCPRLTVQSCLSVPVASIIQSHGNLSWALSAAKGSSSFGETLVCFLQQELQPQVPDPMATPIVPGWWPGFGHSKRCKFNNVGSSLPGHSLSDLSLPFTLSQLFQIQIQSQPHLLVEGNYLPGWPPYHTLHRSHQSDPRGSANEEVHCIIAKTGKQLYGQQKGLH